MARHKKPVLGQALDRTDDLRLARISPPDPRKVGTRLSQRLLPQLPHDKVVSPTKIRHTAVPRRGSR